VKFRLLASLHQHACHADQAVEPRLDVVRGYFPEIGLRDRVRRQAVADDRKTREIEAVRLDLRGGRKRALYARHRSIHELQRLQHVHVPVEEQADIGSAAA